MASSISPTLAINEEIARRRAAGLATVALGFGEASIPVHPELVRRLGEYAGRGGYGPVAGAPELLEAVAGYLSRRDIPTEPGQVVAGPGSKPLLYALLQAIGPTALPQPSWVSYAAQARLLGLDAPLVPTVAGGLPSPEGLAAVADRVRAVLITLPDNPTGTVATPDQVRELVEVARAHDLLIISDEIYRDLVYDPGVTLLTSPAELDPDRTIVTTGLSKNLALGGWRLGVARFPATARGVRLRSVVLDEASEIWSAPAVPVQLAAAWAFTEPEVLVERVRASAVLHGTVARAVTEVFVGAGARVAPPTAGFYLYPEFTESRFGTSPELAAALLDAGVATLPGTAFGDPPERITLRVATPMLYGPTDEQRLAALESPDPASLPWIAAALEELGKALAAVG